MKTRVVPQLLACVLAVLVAAPLANATTVDKTSYSGPTYCALNSCSIAVVQSVSSDSTNGYDCIGSPGAYEACVVYHSCEADVYGDLLTEGYVQCYSDVSVGTAGSCSSLLGGPCSAWADEPQVLLYAGWCVDFYAVGSVSALLSSASASAPPLTVCVNANGPY